MDNIIYSKFALPIVLGLIMFNLGLSLTWRDFKHIFVFPKALLIGLLAQMILLPLVAFALAYISDLPAVLKVGLVLVAACPGGATSNLISYLFKGDVPLSISLTSTNSLLILFTIPGITFLAMHLFLEQGELIELPLTQTISKIFLMILMPTFAGVMLRYYYEVVAIKIENVMKYASTVLLAIIYVFVFLENNNGTSSWSLMKQVLPYALILNILGMLIGLIAGSISRLKTKQIITLIIEVGIQNSALAITIASSQVFLGNSKMAIPAVVYGMFTFFNAMLFSYIVKKWVIKT